jgi:tRNA pseudouridine38-40 synthase
MQDRVAGDQAGKPAIILRNIRLKAAFNGAAYQGWQIQPGRPTVQGTLTEAISRLIGEEVKLIGSGRTDAGTHARGLVCNFKTGCRIPLKAWVPALNRILPPDLRILSASRAGMDFHARISARSKVYRYQIHCGKVIPPHLSFEHFHYPCPIDLKIMQEAAHRFLGEHDFASFAARSGKKKASDKDGPAAGRDLETNTVRTIFGCSLKKAGPRLIFTVEGSGFLHHMVRNMVGTLLELGRGRIQMEQFLDLLETRDRTRAGFTVPAHGLILMRVNYPKSRDRRGI